MWREPKERKKRRGQQGVLRCLERGPRYFYGTKILKGEKTLSS
jgi:hypothetical protein